MLLKMPEDLLQEDLSLLHGVNGHKDVIQIDEDVVQHLIHEALIDSPAFLSPKGILRNSPKGVMTAVLGMSTRTWRRSSLLKTFFPASLAERSSMCGGRYMSCLVTRFSHRLSPQGHHMLSFFSTMCSCKERLLLE